MIHPAGPILATLILLLTGCALPPETKPATASQTEALWQQHRAKMSGISSWHLKGKIAVKTGRKGGNAALLWKQRRDHQEIELYGPFGGGRVQISARPGQAVLKDTKGQTIEETTATEVLYKRLGWQVPFQELYYWVRGIHDEGATGISLDNAGRLQSLQQGNWLVKYLDYKTVGQLDLPRKLSITAVPGSLEIYDRNGEYIGDQLSVKVVLTRWWDIGFAE